MGMGQICTRVKNNKQFIEKNKKEKNIKLPTEDKG